MINYTKQEIENTIYKLKELIKSSEDRNIIQKAKTSIKYYKRLLEKKLKEISTF